MIVHSIRFALAIIVAIVFLPTAVSGNPPARKTTATKPAPAKPRAMPRRVVTARFPVPIPIYMTEIIESAAQQYGVDPNLVAAMAYRESRFDTRAVSHLGAQGVMQLIPRTAKYLGVTDPFDARQNIFGGTRYLREMLDTFDGDVEMALAGYNAGPVAVKKRGKGATQEAVEYVAAIIKQYKAGLLGQ